MVHQSGFKLLVIVALLATSLLAACAPAPAQPSAPAAPAQPTTAPAPAQPTQVAQPTAEQAAAGSKLNLKVAYVFPGPSNDGGFDQVGYEGMLKAQKDLGITTKYVESINVPDAAKVLRNYANEGFDVVVGYSGAFVSPVLEVAKDFPKTVFVTIAGPGEYPDNVWIIGNDFEDAYFLAGALSGMLTKTNKLGHVGGFEIPIYAGAGKAFAAGAKYTNPKAETFETFVGDFNDSVGGKKTAAAQIENGADIILSSMDVGINGIIEAARDAKNVQVIGLTTDQYDRAPDVILTSVLLNYPDMVQRIFKAIAVGQKHGYQPTSLKAGTSSLADFRGKVPADVAKKLDDIKAKVLAGEIKYPTTADLPKK
jgi:basic membrane protein A